MYDKNYGGYQNKNNRYFAVRWKGNDAGNELKCFMLIDKAKNLSDYQTASSYLHTAGQNFAFASKSGDIAIKTQGEFPAKWTGQGDYIMPGTDSSYLWKAMIPPSETPMQLNPERGFVSSANQRPTDSTYPYYLGRGYPPYRGFIINRKLNGMNSVTPQDMMDMQTNNDNIFAEMAMPVILKNVKEDLLNADEKKYLEILKRWNLSNNPGEQGPTIFELTWKAFYDTVWSDEFANAPKVIMLPYESTLLEGILKDSNYKFLDNINTPGIETLADDVTAAFKKAAMNIKEADTKGNLGWAKFKDTRITHLAKLEPFSRLHIPIGGGRYCIDAAKSEHGPSWRMVVSLTPETQAFGVYPGGQSGNPGSRFYDSFIDTWAAGKYFDLWMMKNTDQKNKRVALKLTFNNM